MRLSVGIAVSILVAFSIGVSTFVVHSLWWTTARDNSRMLAAEINTQIANTVRTEVGATLGSAEAAWAARVHIPLQLFSGKLQRAAERHATRPATSKMSASRVFKLPAMGADS